MQSILTSLLARPGELALNVPAWRKPAGKDASITSTDFGVFMFGGNEASTITDVGVLTIGLYPVTCEYFR